MTDSMTSRLLNLAIHLRLRASPQSGQAGRWLLCGLLTLTIAACGDNGRTVSAEPTISLTSELGGSTEGYARACEVREFVFPDDHAAHAGFRNEWWYVTGNLDDAEGRKYGFHATFFRIANQPAQVNSATTEAMTLAQQSSPNWNTSSNWAASQFYMGHFAITEEGSSKTLAHERFARAAAGLAGASAKPVRVWLDDWVLKGPTLEHSYVHTERSSPDIVNTINPGVDDTQGDSGQLPGNSPDSTQADSIEADITQADSTRADSTVVNNVRVKSPAVDNLANSRWQLTMASQSEAVDLTLIAKKPMVLQGDSGLSYKSSGECNASYYYSISRLEATGDITVAGKKYSVTGTAWLDREWSSSVLADDQVGWDWFALQLLDGRELMIYQLRKKNDQPDTHSYAVEIDRHGIKKIIPAEQINIKVDRWWTSTSGASYPVAGSIYRADTDETIVYRPLIDNQELPLTVRYWEGAILLSDASDNPVGRGYLELTGY